MSSDDDDVDAAGGRGPTVHRLILGSQLHRLRTAAGVSSDEAARAIRASRSKISRLENGRVGFKDRDVDDLLTLWITPGTLEALIPGRMQSHGGTEEVPG